MPLVLTTPDRAFLKDASRRVAARDLASETEAFVLEAQIYAAGLSEALRRSLLGFRRFGHASGAILIRGVPLGDVPPTPQRAEAAANLTREAAAAMSVLVACLGEQYGFRPEYGGRIVQHLLPVRGFETQQISVGSMVDLAMHTELAFSPLRPDYVALLCVREDHERVAGTTLGALHAMLPLVDAPTVELLRQPRFRTKVDVSFRLADHLAEDPWIDPIRIVDGPCLRVDFGETEGKDAAARAALARLARVAARTQVVVRLKPGDLLIVDNHRAVHGRTPFVPRYDGADRWLLRALATKDLRRSAGARPSDGRIVEPDYVAG
jgi:L-asparagine oxygenase